MTREQAEQVREWRERQDYTWRMLAGAWFDAYGEAELDDVFLPGWGPQHNQLAGMELHERATALVGAFE